MKNIKYLLLCLAFIYACTTPVQDSDTKDDFTEIESNPTETEEATEDSNIGADVVSNAAEEIEIENHHLIDKEDLLELEYLMTFIPDDHLVLDYEYGNLNNDELEKDVILISHSKKEQTEDFYEGERNLYILCRNSEGKLIEVGMNPDVVLCKGCGGIFGDPYNTIAIKNGYFSIEHYGGSNWRWTRIITFKHDGQKKDWFLHKDGGVSYHTSDPEGKEEEEIATTKDFGIVAFKDFKNED